MKNLKRASVIAAAVLILALYYLGARHQEYRRDKEEGRRGWPAAITWDEPFVGHINVYCEEKGSGDRRIKLFLREDKAYFCLPSFFNEDALVADYDEGDFELYLGGKRIRSGERPDPAEDGEELRIIYKSDAYGSIERSYTLTVMKSGGMGCMFVETESGSTRDIDSSKLNIDRGTVSCFSENGENLGNARIGELRARGQSSFEMAKKNYRLELDRDTSLLGLKAGSEWILGANALDASRIRNALAFDMAKALGVEDTGDYRYTDLYINGEYRGNYMLMQPVTAGFMSDQFAHDDSFMLETETLEERLKQESVYMKRPDGLYLEYLWPRLPDEGQQKAAEEIIGEADRRIRELSPDDGLEGLWEIADVDSFVRIYLMELLTNDIDSGQHSSFCFYDGGRGKLVLGPVWDYDKAFGNQKDLNALPEFEAFAHSWPQILGKNREFTALALEEYERLLPFIRSMESGGISEISERIALSWEMDRVVNGGPISSVVNMGSRQGEADQIIDYFTKECDEVGDALRNPGDYIRIYFGSPEGRAYRMKKGEKLSEEALSYLKKVYGCEGFEPELSPGMEPDEDMLVIPR